MLLFGENAHTPLGASGDDVLGERPAGGRAARAAVNAALRFGNAADLFHFLHCHGNVLVQPERGAGGGSFFPAHILAGTVVRRQSGGKLVHHLLEPRLGDKRVFHRERTADAAGVAGVQLDEINVGELAVLQRFENADNVFNAGSGKMVRLARGGRLSAGDRPADADGACLRINGKRVYQRLVLDQGYYGAGIYTAADDGDFLRDIERARRLGFNGARLHQRVFERRFLYEADKAGFLVWGEYANWGFDHTAEGMLGHFLPEWTEAMERDYNHPALIGWCPFNETWDAHDGRHQNDTLLRDVYTATKHLDPMRPCIDTSGNYHVVTDIYDIHDYQQDIAALHRRYDKFEDGEAFENRPGRQQYRGEPYMISEYGGIRWTNDESGWGYGDAPKTLEEYLERYCAMAEIMAANPRICGVCYTQLYDVEQEQNGIYNYDRTPKFDEAAMDRMAEAMRAPAAIEKE